MGAGGALRGRRGAGVGGFRPGTLAPTGRVKGGGGDLWKVTGWRPRGAYRGAFGDAGAQPDQGAASDTAGPPGPRYVQGGPSQNEARAAEMAQHLPPPGAAPPLLPPPQPHDRDHVAPSPHPP